MEMSEHHSNQDTGEVIQMPAPDRMVLQAMPIEISKALIAVSKQIKRLGVDDTNKHGGYPFVSVDKFYENIGPLMAENGLLLMIDEMGAEVRQRETSKGEIVRWLFMNYLLWFVHESGTMSSPVRRSCALPISGPQAYGAAQSYIEKQFLRQVFKVPTGDKDADSEVPDQPAPPSRQTAPQLPASRSKPPIDRRMDAPTVTARSTQSDPLTALRTGVEAPADHPEAPQAREAYMKLTVAIENAKSVKALDELILHCGEDGKLTKEYSDDMLLIGRVHKESFDDLVAVARGKRQELLTSA